MTHKFPQLVSENRIWLVLYYIVNVFHFQFLLKYFLCRQLNILGLNNLIGKKLCCLSRLTKYLCIIVCVTEYKVSACVSH